MRLIWWLFYRKRQPNYVLWFVDWGYQREQKWRRLQRKWYLHRETISWVTAIIMAVIIGLVIVGLINWLLPV